MTSVRGRNPLMDDSNTSGMRRGSAGDRPLRGQAGVEERRPAWEVGDNDPPRVGWGMRMVQFGGWLYLVVAVAAWATMHWGADRWWWATVISFLPRWLWALPALLLLPLACWRPRRLALATALSLVWVGWPLMGLCGFRSLLSGPLPVAARTDAGVPPTVVKVLTCNLGTSGYDPLELAELVAETQPDLISFQEGISGVELAALVGPDWRVAGVTGLAVASRWPITKADLLNWRGEAHGRPVALRIRCRIAPTEPALLTPLLAPDDLPPPSGEERREPPPAEPPAEEFDFVAVHLLTPRDGLEAVKDRMPEAGRRMTANTDVRRAESTKVLHWLENLPGPVIVAGDMNMPPESNVLRHEWAQFTDAFTAAGLGYGYTYGYTTSGWWYGIRIDHVLADAGWSVERSWVGRHVGSDHRPLCAELRRLAPEQEP
ncbi:MAG: endonuclease/exonuclease/phosphatase family protein [Pirellulales bacterium]